MKVSNINNHQTKESGQALLITLLIISIATTVALALIGRTTTDTSMSRQVEDSSRAFSAAEAGIEEVLKTGVVPGGAQILNAAGQSGASYNVQQFTMGGGTGKYILPEITKRDQTASVWLSSHNANGTLDTNPASGLPRYTTDTLDMCWSAANDPAVIATVLYYRNSTGTFQVAKAAYDTTVSGRGNSFTAIAPNTCAAQAGYYGTRLTFSTLGINLVGGDVLLVLRLRPTYADAQLLVATTGVSALPLQGNRWDSTGTIGAGDATVSRKVVVYQQYRTAPTIFDAAIYSQNTIIQ
jgi:hypothetical protein